MVRSPVAAKRPNADEAAPVNRHVAYAIKALAQGKASEAQQIAALNWIITYACGTDCSAYSRMSDRDTCFALGKQFVAAQINGVITIDPGLLKD
jgi:hypothetical protein